LQVQVRQQYMADAVDAVPVAVVEPGAGGTVVNEGRQAGVGQFEHDGRGVHRFERAGRVVEGLRLVVALAGCVEKSVHAGGVAGKRVLGHVHPEFISAAEAGVP